MPVPSRYDIGSRDPTPPDALAAIARNAALGMPNNAPYPYSTPPAPAAPAAPAAPQVPGWAQPWEAMGLSPEYYLRFGGAANDGGGGQPSGGGGGQAQPQYLSPPPGMGATPGIAPPIPNPMAPQQPTISPLVPGSYTMLDIPEELYSFVPEPLRQGFGGAVSAFLQRLGYQGMGNVGRYGERSYAFPAGTSTPFFSPEMLSYIGDPYFRQLLQFILGERGQAPRIPLPAAPAMA